MQGRSQHSVGCPRHEPNSGSAFFDRTMPVSAHLQSGRQAITELGLFCLVNMHGRKTSHTSKLQHVS
jgi:hypothetical protein